VRTALTLVAVLGLAVTGVVVALTQFGTSPLINERCAAFSNGTSWYLTPAQADNAATITGISVRRGLPARAATIGLATALQESKLVNLDHGDRDSVGLFQQRPSQGWGAIEQLMDPVYAANAFYDALVKVAGYEALPITDAAQKVQRSGFPLAYAQHETRARAWASALTGNSSAAVTCELKPAATAGSAAAVTGRMERDFGPLPTSTGAAGSADSGTGATLRVDAAPLGSGSAADNERLAWAVAQWSVAAANALDIDSVATGGKVWSRSAPTWTASDAPVPAGKVTLQLALPAQ